MNVGATSQSKGVVNIATGSFTSDNTDAVVTLGFHPRWVRMIMITDADSVEKMEGMATNTTFETVSDVAAANTGSEIVLGERGFTAKAALVGNSKAWCFVAIG